MDIRPITNPADRSAITRNILEALPDWFAIEEAIDDYVREVAEKETWGAYVNDQVVGMVSLQETSEYASEIHVMGILTEYHHQGIGRALVNVTEEHARSQNKKWLLVKTLGGQHPDPYYGGTRKFYQAVGFLPLETTELWGEDLPCLNMIKAID